MIYSTVIYLLTVAATFGASTLASPAAGEASVDITEPRLPAGYAMTNLTMKYEGPLREGGANVTLEGTVEQIVAKIVALDPAFLLNITTPTTRAGGGAPAEATVERRGGDVYCNIHGLGPAWDEAVREAVHYLETLPGTCTARPGPGYCGKISCSYDSAVWWCNDRTKPVRYPCRWFAPYVSRVIDRCDHSYENIVQGQSFSSDGTFNVIVGQSKC